MAKNDLILCDTTIIIQFLRGNNKTKDQIIDIGRSSIVLSIITHAEVYYGTTSKEKNKIRKFLDSFKYFPIDKETSTIFRGIAINYFHKSFRPIIPDALIAATAIRNNLKLFTYNRKDFDFIPEIKFYNP